MSPRAEFLRALTLIGTVKVSYARFQGLKSIYQLKMSQRTVEQHITLLRAALPGIYSLHCIEQGNLCIDSAVIPPRPWNLLLLDRVSFQQLPRDRSEGQRLRQGRLRQ
jgi:hypothetical protein